MTKTPALPERIAATEAADALAHAKAIGSALSARLTALNTHIDDAKAAHADAIETASRALADGADALSVLPLDLAKQEIEVTVLTNALAIAGEKIVVLRAKADGANTTAERAEAALSAAKAVAALADRGLTVSMSGAQITTAKLVSGPSFQCASLSDAEDLAGLVVATGIWPWGRDKALTQIHRLAKKATENAA